MTEENEKLQEKVKQLEMETEELRKTKKVLEGNNGCIRALLFFSVNYKYSDKTKMIWDCVELVYFPHNPQPTIIIFKINLFKMATVTVKRAIYNISFKKQYWLPTNIIGPGTKLIYATVYCFTWIMYSGSYEL